PVQGGDVGRQPRGAALQLGRRHRQQQAATGKVEGAVGDDRGPRRGRRQPFQRGQARRQAVALGGQRRRFFLPGGPQPRQVVLQPGQLGLGRLCVGPGLHQLGLEGGCLLAERRRRGGEVGRLLPARRQGRLDVLQLPRVLRQRGDGKEV